MDNQVKCVVVTPERTVVDAAADFVAVPMYDGELGVLPGRSPVIGRLGAGELRYRHGDATHRFFVDGGFVQIRANVVTVLTPKAVRAEDVNAAALRAEIEANRKPAATSEARDAQQKAISRARTQLHVASKAGVTG